AATSRTRTTSTARPVSAATARTTASAGCSPCLIPPPGSSQVPGPAGPAARVSSTAPDGSWQTPYALMRRCCRLTRHLRGPGQGRSCRPDGTGGGERLGGHLGERERRDLVGGEPVRAGGGAALLGHPRLGRFRDHDPVERAHPVPVDRVALRTERG